MSTMPSFENVTSKQLINFADDVVESLYVHLPGNFGPQDLQTIIPSQQLDSVPFDQKLQWLKNAIVALEKNLHNGEISN